MADVCAYICIFTITTTHTQNTAFLSVTNEQPFQDHLSFKSIVLTQRSLLGDLNNEQHSEVFPSVINKRPFQDTIAMTHQALSPKRMAFFKIIF